MDLYMYDRIKIDEHAFQFACHKDVPCFTRCCHDADAYLYPYDIIRLKKRLDMKSDQFIEQFTYIAFCEHPYFPSVMLKMSNAPGAPCPFLNDKGCRVYEDRPFSCRTYPLEPDIGQIDDALQKTTFFLCRHGHCLGHHEQRKWHVNEWLSNQQAGEYHEINLKWTHLSLLFRQNPWGDSGIQSELFKMAFMASYNIDLFKSFVFSKSFMNQFVLTAQEYEILKQSDRELLLLGFAYIEYFLAGKGPLKEKEIK